MSATVCSANNPPLSFRTRLGVFVTFEASLISAVSVFILLCYTVYRVTKRILERRSIGKTDSQSNRLLPIDATDSLGFIVLMFWELVKALGGMMNMRWVLQGCITEGDFCTAQGYLRQIGDIGSAFFSLFIGFDTFFVLVFGWRAPSSINVGAIIGICLFMVLLVAIGGGINHGKYPPYMGSTVYWCWIRREYMAYQISLEYLWMWITAIVQTILYGIIAPVVRGALVVEGRWLRRSKVQDNVLTKTESQSSDVDDVERDNRIIANLILFYPAIYIICVLPLSIVRWRYFAQGVQSPASVTITSTIFGLSGFFNAVFYAFTRPELVSGQTLEASLPSQSTASPTAVSVLPASSREEPIRRRTVQGRLPDDDEPMSPNPPLNRIGSTSVTR